MTSDIVEKILTLYGLEQAIVSPPQKGYRNASYKIKQGENLYNLILFKRESEILEVIRKTNAIGSFLHARALPVRYPLDKRILQVYGGDHPLYCCLYNYLPGDTIPWEAYTRKHLVELGRTFGNLHGHLAGFGGSELPQVAMQHSKILEKVELYLKDSGVIEALGRKLQLTVNVDFSTFEKVCRALGASRYPQPLHMDFVRGNVLFDDQAAITGIIDFEKAAIGHPLFDIARTLSFLLVDCLYKEEGEVYKAFLYSGYLKRGTRILSRIKYDRADNTLTVLDRLITMFLLHDFYKFLKHNPYEFLHRNNHYLRTRDQLIKRNVLQQL